MMKKTFNRLDSGEEKRREGKVILIKLQIEIKSTIKF
jgi:hypothetical protein